MINLQRGQLFVLACLIAFHSWIASALQAHEPTPAAVDGEMRQAAVALLESLGPKLRKQASFAMDGPERVDWQFVPMERKGVALKEMNFEQRRAAHRLMRTALSSKGYLKATTIMSLDLVLREIETDRPDVDSVRDPAKYWFAVFGDPASKEPWGWRVEGHHLSLNFSSAAGKLIVASPRFFGANPAEIQVGSRAGLRALGEEEDLARAIVATMSPEQKKKLIIAMEAPADILTGPGKSLDIGLPVGLPVSEMTTRQRELLMDLVGEFAHNLRPELADQELREIEQAGVDEIHFAWAGSLEPGQGHYYRIHGPTFIVEYDNPEGNHVHTVWHSPHDDFGIDSLRRHYEESPHHHAE
jgi:hypothetical protein